MKKITLSKDSVLKYILWLGILIYGGLCTYLHYMQTFHVEGGAFESDLPYHISMAVDDGWAYSLTGLIYQVFFKAGIGNLLTALFLAAVTVATIYVTYLLLEELCKKASLPKANQPLLILIAFLTNVVMPFYLEWAYYRRYIGWQSASVWHNSTYTCMKLVGAIVFLMYLKLEPKYKDGLTIKEWLLMAFLFILANAVKPSFILVFAPAMALYLLVDLLQKVKFGKIFLFGLTVIPSLLVILWQNAVLFGDDTGNGIIFAYAHTMSLHGTHPKVSLLLSVAFPIFVALVLWKEFFADKWYRFCYLVWGVGLFQYVFLAEDGARSRDGNFNWGYAFGIFLIMLVSLVKLLQVWAQPKGIFKNKLIRYTFLGIATAIFAYQCYCGLYFFSRLCQGVTYWM